MGAARGITADQRPPSPPVLLGQLSQGEASGGDVVGGRVRARVAGPKEGCDRFAGSSRAVVDEAHERVVSVGLLPGRGRVLLVRVSDDQDPVQVHGHLSAGVRSTIVGQFPDPPADFGTCGADRGQRLLAGGGEGVDQTGDRWVGGDWPERGRLGPQKCDVGEAIPAECDRQREVHEHLAGVVDGSRSPPRGQGCGYRLVKADLADRFDQQDRTGLRDHGPAVIPDKDVGIGPDRLLHLESASDRGGNKDLSNPHSRWSEALSACLITCRTVRFMKARG